MIPVHQHVRIRTAVAIFNDPFSLLMKHRKVTQSDEYQHVMCDDESIYPKNVRISSHLHEM